MKFAELDPQFVVVTEPGKSYKAADSLAAAQGVMFLCPKCFGANGGEVGTHSIICWFRGRGVEDTETPGPGRWVPSGTSLDDLSLSPSVALPETGCAWHGFVTAGSVSSC